MATAKNIKVCNDSFSEYIHKVKTKDITPVQDGIQSWRNFFAYLLYIQPTTLSGYKTYFCCVGTPFIVIWVMCLRLAHFNFFHNIYTFPIQPINAMYMLPADLIYDAVSVFNATVLMVVVLGFPVMYWVFAIVLRAFSKNIVACDDLLLD